LVAYTTRSLSPETLGAAFSSRVCAVALSVPDNRLLLA
jgi:hypothetical protein